MRTPLAAVGASEGGAAVGGVGADGDPAQIEERPMRRGEVERTRRSTDGGERRRLDLEHADGTHLRQALYPAQGQRAPIEIDGQHAIRTARSAQERAEPRTRVRRRGRARGARGGAELRRWFGPGTAAAEREARERGKGEREQHLP